MIGFTTLFDIVRRHLIYFCRRCLAWCDRFCPVAKHGAWDRNARRIARNWRVATPCHSQPLDRSTRWSSNRYPLLDTPMSSGEHVDFPHFALNQTPNMTNVGLSENCVGPKNHRLIDSGSSPMFEQSHLKLSVSL